MPTEEKTPNPDRERTDESLRLERAKADSDLAERLAAIEEAADAVTEKARAKADAAVAAARARTDRAAAPPSRQSSKLIDSQRAREDETLDAERAAADEALRVERTEHAILKTLERDETDQDLSRERARSDASVSARDAFLGIVSHDLRNMLNGMVGFASLIATEVSSANYDQHVVEYARRIQRAGARMNRLVGDLVDVASIEAGRLAVSREHGDLAVVVTEAVETFQAQASACGISLLAECASPVPRVLFDPARILQVLANLLSNALKFTRQGGKVTVGVEPIGKDLRVAVADNGEGIPRERLQEIFERFLQVAENDRRGVGLGLYISKCIVQGHGGRIWAESTPGEGSTFYFTLPLEVARPERE